MPIGISISSSAFWVDGGRVRDGGVFNKKFMVVTKDGGLDSDMLYWAFIESKVEGGNPKPACVNFK